MSRLETMQVSRVETLYRTLNTGSYDGVLAAPEEEDGTAGSAASGGKSGTGGGGAAGGGRGKGTGKGKGGKVGRAGYKKQSHSSIRVRAVGTKDPLMTLAQARWSVFVVRLVMPSTPTSGTTRTKRKRTAARMALLVVMVVVSAVVVAVVVVVVVVVVCNWRRTLFCSLMMRCVPRWMPRLLAKLLPLEDKKAGRMVERGAVVEAVRPLPPSPPLPLRLPLPTLPPPRGALKKAAQVVVQVMV